MPAGFTTDQMPSRYQPLIDRLAACDEDELVLTFKEVAGLIGRRALPESAILHRAWWTNKESGHVQAWRALGWRARPDLDHLRAHFLRDADRE